MAANNDNDGGNNNALPVERFGDIFRSGVDHPGNFAYATDNISIPPHYISLVNSGNLFHGCEDEEPISHLNAFYELTINHRPPNVEHDRIKRALFPFLLRDKAREWYDSLPWYNVATFEELKSKFLLEYNSPMKIERLRDAITSFQQKDDETFAEAWKRFSEMLRKCPSHGLASGRDLIKFYQGLNSESMGVINVSTGGDLDNKTHDEVRALFQRLADNQRNWYNPRRIAGKTNDTFGVTVESERMTAVEAQLATISTQMTSVVKAVASMQLTPQPPTALLVKCGVCQGGHHTDQCQMVQSHDVEAVNFLGQGQSYNQQNWRPQQGNWNQQGGNPSSSTQWRHNSPPGFERRKTSLEDQMGQIFSFMTKNKKENDQFKMLVNEKFGQYDASMKNLEVKVGQLATAIHTRAPGTIPSDTVPNPKGKEHCNAIKLRSGKELESPIMLDAQSGSNILHAGADEMLCSQTSHAGADERNERATSETQKKKPLSPAMDPKSPFNFPDFIPPPPFPIEKKKKRMIQEKGLDWMMNIIRKVNVDVSLVDLFLHFPKFSKFFKDLIAKKEKIQDNGVVILSAFCSQFVKGKMPAKRKDPGSCVIPCEMGDKKFPKCLLDQGSGISLMALKTARSIGLEARIEPIDIDLQLADHSIIKPKGIIEDVLVKVDKFVLPVDFIVLEMEEDKDMPILFGRPFLATGDVVIETKTNTVMFRVDGEKVVIKQEKARKRLLEHG